MLREFNLAETKSCIYKGRQSLVEDQRRIISQV